MHVYLLNSIRTRQAERAIYSMHNSMFNGVVGRRGGQLPPVDPRHFGGPPAETLAIQKNVWDLADFLEPAGADFVISERVKQAMADLPHLEFWPVVFEKLFYMEYEFGREYCRQRQIGDGGEYVRKLPGQAGLESRIGAYYELVTPNYEYHQLGKMYPNKRLLRVVVPDTVYIGQTMEVLLSDEMVAEYPMIGHRHATICNEEAYQRLREFVDIRYFVWQPVWF